MMIFKKATFGLSFLIALLCLQGCRREMNLPPEHVKKYLAVCDSNGGVKEFVLNTSDARHEDHAIDRVICNDGAVFDSIVINRKT